MSWTTKRSVSEEPITPRAVLRVVKVVFMYWQGILIVVSVIEAVYLTNHPQFDLQFGCERKAVSMKNL
jgi:hypothetical protein